MMIKLEGKHDPFAWKYGILYVKRERAGTNIRVYKTEEDRDHAFDLAIEKKIISRPIDGEVNVSSVVKVLIQGDTYKDISNDEVDV